MYSNDEILQFVNIVAEVVDPDRIILFGSYAYGKPTEQSDIDLLVIKNGKDFTIDDEVKYDVAIHRARRHKQIKTRYDVFFGTESQISEIALKGGSYVDALQKGKIVYERV
jgi:predicted nucleotidyltransferase